MGGDVPAQQRRYPARSTAATIQCAGAWVFWFLAGLAALNAVAIVLPITRIAQ